MTFIATIKDGKVVLPPEVTLPSGTKVRVETVDATSDAKPVGKKLQSLDGRTVDLPADLAENHDHYLHGKPKRARK